MAACKSCGASIPDDSQYCPKCGRPVEAGPAGQGEPWGSQGWYSWHDMRHGYRAARRPEHWGAWWGWGPEWHGDTESWRSRAWSPFWIMLNAVFLGLLIAGFGVLMLLAAGDWISVTWDNVWAYLLIFVGALSVIHGVARYLVSGRRLHPHGVGSGIVLITLGLAWLVALSTDWSQYLWALVIVAGGVVVIVIGVIDYVWMKAARR